MPSQQLKAEGDGAANNVDEWRRVLPLNPPQLWGGGFTLGLFDDQLYHRQKQGKPGGGSDNHGEDHADDHEGAEHVGDGGHRSSQATQANDPSIDEGEQASQEELQDGEIAIGAGDGQNVEEDAEGI